MSVVPAPPPKDHARTGHHPLNPRRRQPEMITMRYRLLPLLLLTALLYACAPPEPPAPEPDIPPTERAQALAEQGELAARRGAAEAAVAQLQRALELAPNHDRADDWRIRLAEIAADRSQTREADELRETLAERPLDVDQRERLALLEASLLLAGGHTLQAWRIIQPMAPPPEAFAERYYQVRAQALERLDLPLDAVRARVERSDRLDDEQALTHNHEQIWALLDNAPLNSLRDRRPVSADRFGGWVELAWLVRNYRLEPRQLDDALARWERRFPSHPGGPYVTDRIVGEYREKMIDPTEIAVLLPLTGPLADAGRAIRDGIMAAHLAAEGDGPDLRILDSAGRDIVALYRRAVSDGAELVIGPLEKGQVDALAGAEELPVPVLALNTLSGGVEGRAGLYQFGLAPEDDAAEAARQARRTGWQRALVLVPDSDWGRRLAEAFSQTFEAAGGEVLEAQRFATDQADHAGPLRALLNLDIGDRRARQVRATLQRSVEHVDRRRQDADFLFLGATTGQARLLVTQLHYHQGVGLPVLATSHIHSTGDDPELWADLDGVLFMETPWMLDAGVRTDDGLDRATLEALWPEPIASHGRLFALGVDAYRLVPYVELLQARGGERIDGFSGRLSMDERGRIQRGLLPARYTHEGPELLQEENGEDLGL
ncbi:penicillin-binding protein activator [Alkalilimnicola ehrlichii MLHE-1]